MFELFLFEIKKRRRSKRKSCKNSKMMF